ncbi:MAG: aminotransferase [Candidatus Sungbacteria bacterium RIFCSPHIGHO2_02_FULL_47_11]|uniref:Aminotransferase n=1 Tax=Candidatus Sungbacteria bacterium RIFCSPHIGHO2_02_FULL_47_11 TaxID=1802270 RepID=A0A1G2KLX2_9BACT|nr:MAG: aminotransferase [Candidatus Sungbacteria bacterium RIFCSPHIGHO2_02_FULL_47_11]
MNTKQKDKKYLGRDEAPRSLVVAKSKGVFVYDERGRKYIDFFMGWCVGNIGWNVEKVIEKLKKFNGPNYVSPGYMYKGWVELAELLAKIAPGKLTKSFRATGGTEAVEIALQAAMTHTKRHKFVSIEGSYHGHSIGAMSIGSSDFRSWYKNLLPNCYKIKPPLDEMAAREVERILSKREVAAFISEPVICNLGVIIPDKKFFDIVQATCKKYGTLLIADEVATGFGRTCKMFASEHYNLKPDILCLAKGATGGFGALGVTMMTDEIAKSFKFCFSLYSTFGWHPLNVEAAVANIKYFLENKSALLKNAEKLSGYFEQRLKQMEFRYPAEIRVKGLAIGVVFNKTGYAGEIILRCLQNGLLLADASAHNFIIFPALNMDIKVAKKGLDILERCL